MNIILDSNILFSALIKDSTTRKLILESEEQFLFPEYIFQELEKYKSEILDKSKMTEWEFNILLDQFLKRVIIIKTSILNKFYDDSLLIAKSVDSQEDTLFFACALAYPKSVIWSNDKKLKNQTAIKVINTADFLQQTFN